MTKIASIKTPSHAIYSTKIAEKEISKCTVRGIMIQNAWINILERWKWIITFLASYYCSLYIGLNKNRIRSLHIWAGNANRTYPSSFICLKPAPVRSSIKSHNNIALNEFFNWLKIGGVVFAKKNEQWRRK